MTNESSKFDKKSQRKRERIRLALPARVLGRESPQHEWTEMTHLIDVTQFGARFRLSRPTEPGRLLQLTMAMPIKLRVFDHIEAQYRIWSVVRNVIVLDPTKEKGALVEVGVAFIGKRPPQSYEANPRQRYQIAQSDVDSGLWSAADSAEGLGKLKPDTEDRRKESRQLIPVAVVIEVFEEGNLVKSEDTVTENISPSGAAVFTSLDLEPGTFLKMRSDQYQTSVLAVVRRRRQGGDGITRLHLEFVGSEWPL